MTKEELCNWFKDCKVEIVAWVPQQTTTIFNIKIFIDDNFCLIVYGDTNKSCLNKILVTVHYLQTLSDKQLKLFKLLLHKNNFITQEVWYLNQITKLTNNQVDTFIEIFEWCNRYLQRVDYTGDRLQEDYLIDNIANYTFDNDDYIATIDLSIDIATLDKTIEQFNMLKPFLQNFIFINTLRGNDYD